jgi:hypothetical protein
VCQAGNNYRYAFAFNGAGVVENGGVTVDALALAMAETIDDFYLESHTYTHPNLTGDDTGLMSYATAYQELSLNKVCLRPPPCVRPC